MRMLLGGLAALLLLAAPPAVAALQTPAQWLGHEVGADGKLADWETIVGYIYHLTAESERADVVELGESTLGRPFLLVILGSEEAVANRDRYQEINQRLYQVDRTDAARARQLAAEGKVVVALSLGLHSVEVAASQASLEMMHRLATAEDEATRAIRENCLVLMVPSMNPDGLDIVVEWYDQTVGTEAEGSYPPRLYHHYAGHDNNRDGFFNNLVETSHWSRLLYREWLPQILLDEHQMGSSGPRLFLPPFDDPLSSTVHPLVYAQLSAAGQQMVSDLTAGGWTGIATSTIFTAEWPGSVRSTGFWHNMLGLLSEAASVRLATPLYFPPGSLRGGGRGLPEYERRANFLQPWPGGWWRLGDIVSLEVDLTWSLLGWAAEQRQALLTNFHAMNAEAVRRGRSEAPYGFVIGLDQHDPGAAHRLAQLLLDGGVEVGYLPGPVTVEGRVHPRGAYLVDAAQPFRPFLLEMLDPPAYPMVRETREGEVIRPYDVTAWALPALLDVEVQPLARRPDGLAAEPVTTPRRTLPRRPPGPVVLPGSDNASYAAAIRILAGGGEVRRFVQGASAGDFLVPDGAGADPVLLATGARALPAPEGAEAPALALPRVALYEPHGGSMDGGWTRLLLDRAGLAYESLDPTSLAEAARRGDGAARLRRRADVLVLPSLSPEELRRGRVPSEPVDVWTPRWPEAWRGGLGGTGAVGLLLDWVRAGGHLVCLGESSAWAVRDLGLPAATTPGEELPREDFYVPGTLLRAQVDSGHPLAWGMPAEVPVYAAHGQAFATRAWTRPTAVPVLYAREDLRVAGFVAGAERLAGRPALVDIPLGQGRVVLFGFSPQHRCQTEATFKLLYNALLRAGEAAPPGGDS